MREPEHQADETELPDPWPAGHGEEPGTSPIEAAAENDTSPWPMRTSQYV